MLAKRKRERKREREREREGRQREEEKGGDRPGQKEETEKTRTGVCSSGLARYREVRSPGAKASTGGEEAPKPVARKEEEEKKEGEKSGKTRDPERSDPCEKPRGVLCPKT